MVDKSKREDGTFSREGPRPRPPREGEIEMAIADYTHAIELNPQHAAVYNSRSGSHCEERSGILLPSLKRTRSAPRNFCIAYYQVVKVEAGPETNDRELGHRSYSPPFARREGNLVLKYFLVRKGAAAWPSAADGHCPFCSVISSLELCPPPTTPRSDGKMRIRST